MSLSETFSQRPPTPFRDLTALALAATFMTLIWAIPEPREIFGNPVWIKPFKFSISFAIFFATLALVASRLSDTVGEGTVLQITVIAMAAAFSVSLATSPSRRRRQSPRITTSRPLSTSTCTGYS